MVEYYVKGKDCQIYDGAYIFPNVTLGDNVTVFPGAVIGRPSAPPEISALKNDTPSPGEVKIGDNCIIGSNTVIYAGVEIGNHTLIGDTTCIREQCRIGSDCLIAAGVTIGCNARIDNKVKIMDNAHIAQNTIIEEKCFISTSVISISDRLMGRKPSYLEEGKIKNGPYIQWGSHIGAGACLFPGVEIGPRAIVGAYTLIRRVVKDKEVVAGNPPRLWRYITDLEIFTE